jgi:hypothetical protein
LLIPIYLKNYGPTNFLYFCDVAALLTLVAIWIESPVILSAVLIGAFVPQMIWVVDFIFEFASWLGMGGEKGVHLTGMTGYMFDAGKPFFLRFLSFFHFWLVFLLIYLVWCVGYDKRGLALWTGIAWVLVTICYVWMPPCSPVKDANGVQLRDPNMPVNINYVYNITSDEESQHWMEPNWYFAVYLTSLVAIYIMTHFFLWWLIPGTRRRVRLL